MTHFSSLNLLFKGHRGQIGLSLFALLCGEDSWLCYYAYCKMIVAKNDVLLDFWATKHIVGQLPPPPPLQGRCGYMSVVAPVYKHSSSVWCTVHLWMMHHTLVHHVLVHTVWSTKTRCTIERCTRARCTNTPRTRAAFFRLFFEAEPFAAMLFVHGTHGHS